MTRAGASGDGVKGSADNDDGESDRRASTSVTCPRFANTPVTRLVSPATVTVTT